ncbi:MAG: DoxX family protein, partial [Ignavibacteria bacterium]
MLSAKPEMMEMFGRWGFDKTAVMSVGLITLISTVMIIFPSTFVWGNFLMAAGILMMICFQISERDLRGAAIEVPFLLLNLILIFLRHPLKN